MDEQYWESFYLKQNISLQPSLFAEYVVKKLIKNKRTIVELGCGNGRDAIYFANNNLNVLAIDLCKSEIDYLKNHYTLIKNLTFLNADFSELDGDLNCDIVYSRFSLHSISSEKEKRVLQWTYNSLNPDGILCIEVRGLKNEIYGKGRPVKNEENAYLYNKHYRRFIRLDAFCDQLISLGFRIEQSEEKKGFAPYNKLNETFIRVIARKK